MNAAKATGNEYGYANFKVLKKVENEHADAIVKLLNIKEPQLKTATCSDDFRTNTKEGWERENRAIKEYAKFANEAPEFPLKQFFKALVTIEIGHLNLHAENLKK